MRCTGCERVLTHVLHPNPSQWGLLKLLELLEQLELAGLAELTKLREL